MVPPPTFADRSVRTGVVLGTGALVLGLAVLVGWWAGIDWLPLPMRRAAAMMPNTAVMLALSGVAVIAIASPAPSRRRRWVGRALALLVVVIATLTQIQRLSGTDLGIDRVVFAVAPGPATNTAIAFVLLGAAVLAIDRRWRRGPAPSELFAIAVAAHALLMGLEYAYGFAYFVRPPELAPAIAMAPHTALGTLLLSIAILVVRPNRGWMALLRSRRPGGVMARRLFLVAAIALPTTNMISLRLQYAGLYQSPADEIVHTALALLVLFGALLAVASRLDRTDEERDRIEASEREAREALQRAHEELAAVERADLAVSEAMASIAETGLDHMLGVIAQQARELTRADYAGLGLDGGEGVPVRSWASAGTGPPPALELGGPHLTIVGLMTVEVSHRGQAIGKLYLGNKRGGAEFTERDQRVVERLAAHVGSAIEVSLLYEREALQRTWLESILAQMPEAVLVVDADGKIVHENEVARGYRSDVSPGQPDRPRWDVRAPSGTPIPAADLPLERAVRIGESTSGVELAILTPAAGMVPILASATPVRIRDRTAGAVAVFRDIRVLKELERLREEWTSLIAHDLRQPLNGMLLAVDLLLRGDVREPGRRHLERIRGDTLRLDAMVEDLLDASVLEARQLSVRPEPVRVLDLIDIVLGRFPELSSRCEVRIAHDSGRVLADPGRIIQVLGNLLSNAQKYSDPGTAIHVDVERDGGVARISVSNHGPALSDEEVGRLFQRFTRTEQARRSGIKGLGLGLYLTRGLVEAHGGRISVDRSGPMTCFRFTLPLMPGEHGPVTSAPALGAASPDARHA
jgi:signal transduction histidine kinase